MQVHSEFKDEGDSPMADIFSMDLDDSSSSASSCDDAFCSHHGVFMHTGSVSSDPLQRPANDAWLGN